MKASKAKRATERKISATQNSTRRTTQVMFITMCMIATRQT